MTGRENLYSSGNAPASGRFNPTGGVFRALARSRLILLETFVLFPITTNLAALAAEGATRGDFSQLASSWMERRDFRFGPDSGCI
jgi:hypothetical protein